MNFIRKLQYSKLCIGYSILVLLIIIGITLIIILISNSIIFNTITNLSEERRCNQLLNNLDSILLIQESGTIRRLLDESCKIRNTNIMSESQFTQELKICNTRSQNLMSQENFIERRDRVCLICSQIQTNSNLEIYTNSLPIEERDNVVESVLRISSNEDNNILYFIIENNNISYYIHTSSESPC